MSKPKEIVSRPKVIKIAGFIFIFAFIIPTLNWTLLLSKLNVPGNAIATVNNILQNEVIFRLGITIELFLSIGLVILGLALYSILKSADKNLAMLGLFLKLIEAALMAVTVLIPFIALQNLKTGEQSSVLMLDQLQTTLGLIINSHMAITSIPMVFLGFDMMIFSYLFYKTEYIPKSLAGFGILSFAFILIQSLMFLLKPEYAMMPISQIVFWAPSGLFEIIIGVWLLTKGIKE